MTITTQLLSLYEVDRQIRGLNGRVKSAERYLTQRNNELAALDTRRESLRMQARQLEAGAHNDETEIGSLDARIEKLREQLNNATTNKQYTAFLTELNTFKADRGKVEERALETLARLDEVRAQLAELDAKREEIVKLRDLAAADLDAKRGEIRDRLEDLQRQRSHAAAVLPADVLRDYEGELELRDDDVMAPIEEMNRRAMEYCCGACQVLLPMEVVSSAITGGKINRCSSCGAFLYIAAETREAAIPTKR